MDAREQYTPGPASGAQVQKGGDKWTLILVRELRHAPEKVWQALTDPAQLREWAPFVVDGSLGTVGSVNLTWVANPTPLATKVTRADAPRLLEYGDMRWQLERQLSGDPIGRIVGAEAMKFAGWQRLIAEYAEQFGVEPP